MATCCKLKDQSHSLTNTEQQPVKAFITTHALIASCENWNNKL